MLSLVFVSLVWAFSFGLIKNQLAGLNSTAVATTRLVLSALIFLPLLRSRGLNRRQIFQLMLAGAVQFGAMYLLYQRAYLYIKAWEVAIFTITTPIYLIWLDALWRRRFEGAHWLAAALSVCGTLIIVWRTGSESVDTKLWLGFALVQLANVCFAQGQLWYRRLRANMTSIPDHRVFGWLYLGAVILTGVVSVVSSSWISFRPTMPQWEVLAYLGLIASGVCFFLWNRGATQVNAGTLAAMNNAKIPLGVACSLLVFGEKADLVRLIGGGTLLLVSVLVAERARAKA